VSIWQFGATAASYWAFAFGATWLLIRSALRDDQDAIRFFWFAVVISGSAMPAISAWKGGVLEIGLGTALPIWLFVFVPAIIIRWLGFRIGGYQPSELKRRSD
jgi:hypothetical protein